MSIRLRELIRAVRACKTAAEERAVIAKESALIRTAIKEENDQFRHRNVAKLLFIHMLGYPSHFGQMECLKLIASPQFYEKRIGYLGLSLLLTEQEEVLTLVTNSLQLDLKNPNPFVVGLALSAVGNLGTEDIARDLAMDIDKHLRSSNSYLRKKAALTMIRIFKKVPDLIEEFSERITSLLKDRSHGVLITGVQLMIEVLRMEPATTTSFVRLVPSLVRLLRNLLTMGYAPDHDVAGITDPFLQVKLLCLLQYLGQQNEETSEAMNDILAQVATNTETAKNAGNAILYECVQTIMSIESETGLRVLAVNILGRFLLNRDNNIRYVALNTLSKVVLKDAAAVQRHRNTIVDCLKDPDVSIRQRALELIYQLVNEGNVTSLAREMLNYLVVAPTEHKASICSKIMVVVEQYAPSRRWRLDTLVTMLSIAGQQCDQAIPNAVVFYISQAEDLQAYITHKIFLLLKEDMSQIGLVTTAVWTIGEYGEYLLVDSPVLDEETASMPAQNPAAIVDLLEKVIKSHSATTVIRCYVLSAFMKLTDRLRGAELARIRALMATFETSMTLELQQRSCEFVNLSEIGARSEMLTRIPLLDEATLKARRARFEESREGEEGSERSASPLRPEGGSSGIKISVSPERNNRAAPTDLLDLDDIFGGTPAPAQSQPAFGSNGGAKPGGGGDLLSDIFASTPVQPVNASRSLTSPLDDLLMSTSIQPQSQPLPNPMGSLAPTAATPYGAMPPPAPGPGGFSMPMAAPPPKPILTAYEKDGLTITMELSKPVPAEPQASHILCRFTNANATPITGLLFQCAVPKYVKLEMNPATGTTVAPNRSGQVEQNIKVQNSMVGQKALQLKIKVQYTVDGRQVNEMGQVSNFPGGY